MNRVLYRISTALLVAVLFFVPAFAVTPAEDVATLIKLRNFDCGGAVVTNMMESVDAVGNKTIVANCPNGKRYQIIVTVNGKVTVTPM